MIYPSDFFNKIVNGNCLDLMNNIPDNTVDMVLCDLPYGTTARNDWDVVIPFEPLWNQYRRITKKNAAIVLTATNPFASKLILSNLSMFRYDIVWQKNKKTGFLNAKRMPLRSHELVLVFYDSLPTYHPQKTHGHKPVNSFTKHTSDGTNYGKTKTGVRGGGQTDRYPGSIVSIPVVNNDSDEKLHPTQKPVALFEYLVRTYTNEGDLVLDNCIGSGTTAVACVNSKRNFIGIEKDPDYWRAAVERLNNLDG